MSVIADHLLVLVAALTSLGSVVLGVRLLRLPARALPRALGAVVDVVGTAVLFFLANAAVGVLFLLAERHLAGRLVSLHRLDDVALYVISALQAIVLQAWRTANRSRGAAPPRGPVSDRGGLGKPVEAPHLE